MYMGRVAPNDQIKALSYTAWAVYLFPLGVLLLTLAIGWLMGDWLTGMLGLGHQSFNTIAGLMLIIGVFTWSTSVLFALSQGDEDAE